MWNIGLRAEGAQTLITTDLGLTPPYQYRFGNDADSSALKNWNFSQDTDEHTVYSSVVVHF